MFTSGKHTCITRHSTERNRLTSAITSCSILWRSISWNLLHHSAYLILLTANTISVIWAKYLPPGDALPYGQYLFTIIVDHSSGVLLQKSSLSRTAQGPCPLRRLFLLLRCIRAFWVLVILIWSPFSCPVGK